MRSHISVKNRVRSPAGCEAEISGSLLLVASLVIRKSSEAADTGSRRSGRLVAYCVIIGFIMQHKPRHEYAGLEQKVNRDGEQRLGNYIGWRQ